MSRPHQPSQSTATNNHMLDKEEQHKSLMNLQLARLDTPPGARRDAFSGSPILPLVQSPRPHEPLGRLLEYAVNTQKRRQTFRYNRSHPALVIDAGQGEARSQHLRDRSVNGSSTCTNCRAERSSNTLAAGSCADTVLSAELSTPGWR